MSGILKETGSIALVVYKIDSWLYVELKTFMDTKKCTVRNVKIRTSKLPK